MSRISLAVLAVLAVLASAAGCGGENSRDGHAPGGGASGGGTGTAKVGDPCTSASDCPGGGSGSPICKTEWPKGYCAVSSCSAHGHDCPNDPGLGGTATTGGKCVLAEGATCLALCGSSAGCRDGYECVAKPDASGKGPVSVCVPTPTGTDGGAGGSGGMGGGGGMMDGGMMDGGM